jgi:osmotically-inducible protein OsmY
MTDNFVRQEVLALTGHVSSYTEKTAADSSVRRVRGEKAAAGDLEVQPADVKLKIENASKWNAEIEAGDLRVRVPDRGAMKLEALALA